MFLRLILILFPLNIKYFLNTSIFYLDDNYNHSNIQMLEIKLCSLSIYISYVSNSWSETYIFFKQNTEVYFLWSFSCKLDIVSLLTCRYSSCSSIHAYMAKMLLLLDYQNIFYTDICHPYCSLSSDDLFPRSYFLKIDKWIMKSWFFIVIVSPHPITTYSFNSILQWFAILWILYNTK